MRRNKSRIWIVIGLLFFAAALLLALYNLGSDLLANARSREIYEALKETDKAEESETLPDYVLFPDMEMPEIEIDGRSYIGTLDIPALDLSLPVMSQWSYPGLRIAPGRYCGSAYSHDLVICGHNYASHFGQLKNLNGDDVIVFTDAEGNVFRYSIVSVEIRNPKDVEGIIHGDWDMTLFTCTVGGAQRVTVRCVLEN